jgi:hypothetical protein
VLLETVKAYIVDVWEIRKARLYGDNPDVQQSQSQCLSGDLGDVAGRVGKLGCPVGKSGHPVGKLGGVILAPPIIVGAWSMAGMLGWPLLV